jgi:hypothetical protein
MVPITAAEESARAERQQTIEALCLFFPDEVLDALLKTQFFPETIEPGVRYKIPGDGVHPGELTVEFGPDRNGHVSIAEPNRLCSFILHFRSPLNGGESEPVRQALMYLAVAIAASEHGRKA